MTTSTESSKPWHPTDERVDIISLNALMCKMEKCIEELEISQFYHDLRDELRSSPISEHIRWFLGSESEMQMVIYGIGSIMKNPCSRLQLSLAILMKKDFAWIGNIEVFDPILSNTEIVILEVLGCSVAYLNENGRKQARKPTMFFMPHCDIELYNNLLEANWEPNMLSNIIIFGNSFDLYIKDLLGFFRNSSSSDDKKRRILVNIWRRMEHILAAQTFTDEFELRAISYHDEEIYWKREAENLYDFSFSSLTWHFFSSLTMRRMRLIRKKTMEEYGVIMRLKQEDLATISNSSDMKE